MDGWNDRWLDGYADGWITEWSDARLDGWMNRYMGIPLRTVHKVSYCMSNYVIT
jgi:hypothetical protein